MIRDSKYPLLAKAASGSGIYQSILKEETGWQFLNFQARLMTKGETWSANTDHPDHKWIYGSWKGRDPRIHVVTAEMNNNK